jgi:putative ATP-binding cassette transporter
VEQLGVDLGQDPVAAAGAEPPSRFERVELAGVTYAFEREGDSAFTLGPIELSVRPGELVFITGGNGSGKTTLAKLIAGLYTPTSGEIRLDGVAIGEERRDDYRQLFTVSFTDGHVFRPLLGLDEQRVRAYLEQFQLQPWVHVADGAFSTTALSQGQRKRLLLATALVEERPFYIFDEWAANQDPQFRERFYRELLPALKARGKAVVVITHDDRYDQVADAVIRLDSGRIRQEPRARQEGGATPSCLSS